MTHLRAQTADRVARVGVLQFGELNAERQRYYEGFRQGLHALGWDEGHNLVLDARYADSKPDRLKELATALTATKPDVIIALGGVSTVRALQATTATIPVIMVGTAVDPVRAGFVQSLAQPGGNITGLISLGPALNEERLEFIKKVAPRAMRIGIVLNPEIWSIEDLRPSASAFGLTLTPIAIRRPEDLPSIPHQITTAGVEALVLLTDPGVLESHLAETLRLVLQTRLPTIFPWRSYVVAGGLMSYATSLEDLYRRAALTVDRILKGASPTTLPVEQPVKFELVINLKTARELGIEFPAGLLARADEVIE